MTLTKTITTTTATALNKEGHLTTRDYGIASIKVLNCIIVILQVNNFLTSLHIANKQFCF